MLRAKNRPTNRVKFRALDPYNSMEKNMLGLFLGLTLSLVLANAANGAGNFGFWYESGRIEIENDVFAIFCPRLSKPNENKFNLFPGLWFESKRPWFGFESMPRNRTLLVAPDAK